MWSNKKVVCLFVLPVVAMSFIASHGYAATDDVIEPNGTANNDYDCSTQCENVYKDASSISIDGDGSISDSNVLYELCYEACMEKSDLFHVDYPYILGPLTIQPYAELTNSDPIELANLTGILYARINKDRNRIQFKYTMDNNHNNESASDNNEPFYPYFAMHLHQGNLDSEEIGGHIISSIAGQGPIVGCIIPPRSPDEPPQVCSEFCTPGSEVRGNCVNPTSLGVQECPVCDVTFAHAYFCKGGCQNDNRIVGNTTMNPLTGQSTIDVVAPSRYCDIGRDNPSNPIQDTWIPGLHSMEFSGNPNDGIHYSPYSIGIEENYDLWCGEDMPFLYDLVLADNAAAYVALHGNFNATGYASLLYGDAFAAISKSIGGVQNCTIFGNEDYPCVDGMPHNVLHGISNPLSSPSSSIDDDGETSNSAESDAISMGGLGANKAFAHIISMIIVIGLL